MRNIIVALRRRLGGEDGSTLIELGVAMMVLSVAVIGVIGSMGIGMSLNGESRQRSAASGIATERIERARNLSCVGAGSATCYSYIAINDPDHPTWGHATGTPDQSVTGSNCQTSLTCTYQLPDGTTEPLVVDTSLGGLRHIDDPVKLGVTPFKVYQYVTWVDDPNITNRPCPAPSTATTCDYKRVTIVVTWSGVKNKASESLTQSTFVSDGTVSLPGLTPSPSAGGSPTATPSGTPTSSPTATPVCGGDATPPTGTIAAVDGAQAETSGYTNSTSVSVKLTATDTCAPITAALSNTNGSFLDQTTLTSGVTSTVIWTIDGTTEGLKTIYAQFRDGAGNRTTTAITTSITYDKTAPSPAPGQPQTVSITKNGSDCDFKMQWTASGDTNFVGYRILRQDGGSGSYAAVNTTPTGSLQYTDTAKKNQLHSYIIRAVDKAGNYADSIAKTYTAGSC